MEMGARGKPAKLAEGFDKILIRIRLCAGKPFEHHQMAWRQLGCPEGLDQRSVPPGKGQRRGHPALFMKRRHPGKFTFDGPVAVISGAVIRSTDR